MYKLKIIETFGDSPNAEFRKWYEERVRETAKFFVRNVDPGYSASRNSGMTMGGTSQHFGMTVMGASQNSKITAKKELLVK